MTRIALDVVGLVGLVVFVYGARLVYAPAAWLVAGAVLVVWAVLKARARRA